MQTEQPHMLASYISFNIKIKSKRTCIGMDIGGPISYAWPCHFLRLMGPYVIKRVL
ncbi:uncharacterized protein DS421_17g592240 [Arachis hypogaea]|nr:uncharacterized protein DS421_17g592240 [Arachis hypogaea]